jgi:hypothetical protein
MDRKWHLYALRPRSMVSFSYESKEQAFYAAHDLESDGQDSILYVENPRGERVERHEAIGCFDSGFGSASFDYRVGVRGRFPLTVGVCTLWPDGLPKVPLGSPLPVRA